MSVNISICTQHFFPFKQFVLFCVISKRLNHPGEDGRRKMFIVYSLTRKNAGFFSGSHKPLNIFKMIISVQIRFPSFDSLFKKHQSCSPVRA